MNTQYNGVIVAVNTNDTHDIKSEVAELKVLAESINIKILGIHIQNRHEIDKRYYVGSGFLKEISEMYEDLDYVIVNDEIKASQNRNIESVLDTSVLDRTQIILDIFSLRADTKAGQLQVELAQLEYLVPRLRGQGINLSRLGGGIGTRGPGETKLETDRRHINRRIKEIKNELKTIENTRKNYRENRNRKKVTKFSLIGYTNAGKSAMFNALTEANTKELNQLFATLDPKTRKLEFQNGFNAIITDTVGFIQKLPTTLVESFKSTLEEAADSDFLIHVIDNHSDHIDEHYRTVQQLLKELDMSHIPTIVLFNKSDLNNELNYITNDTYFLVNKFMEKEELLNKLKKGIKDNYEFYTRNITMNEINELYELKQDTYVTNLTFNEDDEIYTVEGYTKDISIIQEILKEKQ
ncbi:GTPase HflX [Nosocomiicoccus ampullae]|uniref:GTPase HflX n=1 Tax=Nosocomiicoccus ampullae TaxID=489910 RepID=A0A9Q2HFV1_9STAP|nr:GTPase HflX [Nosocomiicoccus ampullae]MBB5176291.1 GTP-binding protein HflX [Nosocomiicoccus ampullae]QYA47452.1 GTPase HflX [Nosocomiicoccus ampullae]